MNHFSNMCRQKSVQMIEEEEVAAHEQNRQMNDEYLFLGSIFCVNNITKY